MIYLTAPEYTDWSQTLSLITNNYYEETIEYNTINFTLWNSRILTFYIVQ